MLRLVVAVVALLAVWFVDAKIAAWIVSAAFVFALAWLRAIAAEMDA